MVVMEVMEFFNVAQPIDRDIFLGITREVLQTSLLIMVPFGLPSQLRQVERSEEMFVRKYGPKFRLILESVSEKIYEARGVSESEVAVTLHKYTEEEKDEEALACVGQMSDALHSVYSPPRVLELPCVIPVNDLARIGLSMVRTGAIYAPEPGRRLENTKWPEGPSGSEAMQPSNCRPEAGLPIVPTNDGTSGDADALPLCMACEARNASVDHSRCLLEASGDLKTCSDDAADSSRGSTSTTLSTKPHVGTPDYEKRRRAYVASCLEAMTTLRRETEEFSESIEQPHLQAMFETFRARRTVGLVKDGSACKCSAASSPSSYDICHDAAVAALDEIAAVSFMDNDIFMMIRALERRDQKVKAPIASDAEATDSNKSKGTEAVLESVLMSQFYRMLADQYLEEGSPREAVRWYDEAYREGAALLPGRCLAELLAGWAQCYQREHDLEDATLKADAALAIDATCGEAFLVRGQCRQSLGDDQGALKDLVKAFVLRGSALNGMTDNGEAQAIEEVSRAACRARAAEAFSIREATDTLPADWVVRSYLASYNRKDLYIEENDRRPLEGQELSGAESSFWRGMSLMQNGRFTESMTSFTEAVKAEDPTLRSLALEYCGSFQYLQRDITGSLESFRRAIVANPTNVKSWVKKGSVLSDLGRSDEAFECFNAAQEINPNDPDLYLHRGQGHLLSNDFRKASKDLQRSVDLCTTMPISWAALGVALFKLGITHEQSFSSSVSECLEIMEDALERFPENSEVLLFFAEILVSMGNYARGLDLLKRSASLDPECPLPYVNAARAYLGMNDLVAARRHLEHGQALDSTYPGTFMDMGQLLMQEGFPAEAMSMYARGVEMARFPSEIHDAMACLDVAKCHLEAQELLLHPDIGLLRTK